MLLLIFHLRAYRLIDLSHEIDPRALQSAFASHLQPQPQQPYASASKQASQRQSAATAAAVNTVSECRVGDGWLSEVSDRRVRECRKDLDAFAQIKFQHVACAALLRLVALLRADFDALGLPAAKGAARK